MKYKLLIRSERKKITYSCAVIHIEIEGCRYETAYVSSRYFPKIRARRLQLDPPKA